MNYVLLDKKEREYLVDTIKEDRKAVVYVELSEPLRSFVIKCLEDLINRLEVGEKQKSKS